MKTDLLALDRITVTVEREASHTREDETLKASIAKTYRVKGDEVVRKNLEAVDQTLARLFQVRVPPAGVKESGRRRLPVVPNRRDGAGAGASNRRGPGTPGAWVRTAAKPRPGSAGIPPA